ncbi:MAG: zinc-dependent peptidase [Myxococcales bacterium]|nr:zinc-dependent peptidase [Myxococcales bacterium]
MIFSWLRRRRRRRLLATPVPADWLKWLARDYELWPRLDDDERARLMAIARVLVDEKSWEAAGGFVLDESAKVVIAAQAALLLLGLGDTHDYYPNVESVVVYPAAYRLPGGGVDAAGVADSRPKAVLGTAHYRGPVVLSWRSARAGGRDADDGRNLVYHEFAHKLDMLDGVVDGTPPLPDERAYKTWFQVMTAHYDALVRAAEAGRKGFLDTYGATNVAEFFAVATEAFFERSRWMRDRQPDLYGALQLFFRQDPARWR